MTTAIESASFQTYAAWLAEQTCFISFDDNADEKADWLVVPVTYCPNVAEILDESNWAALQTMLEHADPTGETYELQRFNHWATPYERFIVAPGSAAHAAAAKAVCALADYPVLNESDYSERECEAQYESVASEVHQLSFERNGESLTAEQEDDLASEICQHASNSECMDRLDVEIALATLGWCYCDDDMTWRPESECVDVEPE